MATIQKMDSIRKFWARQRYSINKVLSFRAAFKGTWLQKNTAAMALNRFDHFLLTMDFLNKAKISLDSLDVCFDARAPGAIDYLKKLITVFDSTSFSISAD